MTAAGQKVGIFALLRAKAGQRCFARGFVTQAASAQTRRCQRSTMSGSEAWKSDHDFVTIIFDRNKLKRRSN